MPHAVVRYTRNGELLGDGFLNVFESNLVPVLGFHSNGESVCVNFGLSSFAYQVFCAHVQYCDVRDEGIRLSDGNTLDGRGLRTVDGSTCAQHKLDAAGCAFPYLPISRMVRC